MTKKQWKTLFPFKSMPVVSYANGGEIKSKRFFVGHGWIQVFTTLQNIKIKKNDMISVGVYANSTLNKKEWCHIGEGGMFTYYRKWPTKKQLKSWTDTDEGMFCGAAIYNPFDYKIYVDIVVICDVNKKDRATATVLVQSLS